MKRYFSAESEHGSSSSHGFSNDTIVLCFNSKSARDEYVSKSENLSCCKIAARDVTKEATNDNIKPHTFWGEFWGIIEYDKEINGCVGEVAVCNDSYSFGAERLYK